ncbi:beta-lactamase [Actinotalea ferrariae CF5-4]|uniref:Beta-lactamase n=1 Tax=Actinotalea ferrariae CF5-4 TaxID=948458 RepID=A0A021VMM7_9CELL|nr:serine hydrolase [Actinotalea ferrariae]EYR62401.1 beta-lactamase [Actinotalea ferrariae CF5-4]
MTETRAPSAAQALPLSAPRQQGVDARGVQAFLDAVEASAAIEPHSLMLLRHGHVVAEGWWAPFSRDRLHLLYSLSKSFTSTALGLAVEEGLVSLDDTVLSHFPELDAEVTDERSRRMLVRHVAAMASGHREETLDRVLALDPRNPVRGFLLLPPDEEPGTVFAYNQPCTYTVASIVTQRTGSGLTDYLRPRLLDPLGIGEVAWHGDHTGMELGFSGLHATTEAIARLGQLYLQRGRWGDEQLVPEAWVEEATRGHVRSDGQGRPVDWSQGYGFQFWMSRHGYRGDGAYGQFCLVLPEQDAVLAMTAATEAMQEVLDAAWEYLLPAMGEMPDGTGGEAGPGGGGERGAADNGARAAAEDAADDGPRDAAEDADAALAARLAALTLPGVPGDTAPPSAEAWLDLRTERSSGPVAVSLATSRVTTSADDEGPGSGRWVVELEADDGAVQLRTEVTGPSWQVHDVDLAAVAGDGARLPVAVSGGWVGERLRLDLAFVETPHRLAIEVDGATREVSSRWLTEPLGTPPLRDLRAQVVSGSARL